MMVIYIVNTRIYNCNCCTQLIMHYGPCHNGIFHGFLSGIGSGYSQNNSSISSFPGLLSFTNSFKLETTARGYFYAMMSRPVRRI